MNLIRTGQLISSMRSLQQPTQQALRLQDLITSIHQFHLTNPSTLRNLFSQYDKSSRGYLEPLQFSQLLEQIIGQPVDTQQLFRLCREALENRVDYQSFIRFVFRLQTKGNGNQPAELLEEVRLWVRRRFARFEDMCVEVEGYREGDLEEKVRVLLKKYCDYLSTIQINRIITHLNSLTTTNNPKTFLFALFDRTPQPTLPLTLPPTPCLPSPEPCPYVAPRPDWQFHLLDFLRRLRQFLLDHNRPLTSFLSLFAKDTKHFTRKEFNSLTKAFNTEGLEFVFNSYYRTTGRFGDREMQGMMENGGDAKGWLVKRYLTKDEEKKLRGILTRKQEIPYYPMMKLSHLSQLLFIQKINLPDMFFRSFSDSEQFNTVQFVCSIDAACSNQQDHIITCIKLMNCQRILRLLKRFKAKRRRMSFRLSRQEKVKVRASGEVVDYLRKVVVAEVVERGMEVAEQREVGRVRGKEQEVRERVVAMGFETRAVRLGRGVGAAGRRRKVRVVGDGVVCQVEVGKLVWWEGNVSTEVEVKDMIDWESCGERKQLYILKPNLKLQVFSIPIKTPLAVISLTQTPYPYPCSFFHNHQPNNRFLVVSPDPKSPLFYVFDKSLQTTHEFHLVEKVNLTNFQPILDKIRPLEKVQGMSQEEFKQWLMETLTLKEYQTLNKEFGIVKMGRAKYSDVERLNEIVKGRENSSEIHEGRRFRMSIMRGFEEYEQLTKKKLQDYWPRDLIAQRIVYIPSRQLFLIAPQNLLSLNLYRLPNPPSTHPSHLATLPLPSTCSTFEFISSKDLVLVCHSTSISIFCLQSSLFLKYSLNPIWTVKPSSTIDFQHSIEQIVFLERSQAVVGLCEKGSRLVVWEREKVGEIRIEGQCQEIVPRYGANEGGQFVVGIISQAGKTMLREYAVVKYKLGLAEEQFCQPIPQKMLMELREHTEKVIKNMKAEKTQNKKEEEDVLPKSIIERCLRSHMIHPETKESVLFKLLQNSASQKNSLTSLYLMIKKTNPNLKYQTFANIITQVIGQGLIDSQAIITSDNPKHPNPNPPSTLPNCNTICQPLSPLTPRQPTFRTSRNSSTSTPPVLCLRTFTQRNLLLTHLFQLPRSTLTSVQSSLTNYPDVSTFQRLLKSELPPDLYPVIDSFVKEARANEGYNCREVIECYKSSTKEVRLEQEYQEVMRELTKVLMAAKKRGLKLDKAVQFMGVGETLGFLGVEGDAGRILRGKTDREAATILTSLSNNLSLSLSSPTWSESSTLFLTPSLRHKLSSNLLILTHIVSRLLPCTVVSAQHLFETLNLELESEFTEEEIRKTVLFAVMGSNRDERLRARLRRGKVGREGWGGGREEVMVNAGLMVEAIQQGVAGGNDEDVRAVNKKGVIDEGIKQSVLQKLKNLPNYQQKLFSWSQSAQQCPTLSTFPATLSTPESSHLSSIPPHTLLSHLIPTATLSSLHTSSSLLLFFQHMITKQLLIKQTLQGVKDQCELEYRLMKAGVKNRRCIVERMGGEVDWARVSGVLIEAVQAGKGVGRFVEGFQREVYGLCARGSWDGMDEQKMFEEIVNALPIYTLSYLQHCPSPSDPPPSSLFQSLISTHPPFPHRPITSNFLTHLHHFPSLLHQGTTTLSKLLKPHPNALQLFHQLAGQNTKLTIESLREVVVQQEEVLPVWLVLGNKEEVSYVEFLKVMRDQGVVQVDSRPLESYLREWAGLCGFLMSKEKVKGKKNQAANAELTVESLRELCKAANLKLSAQSITHLFNVLHKTTHTPLLIQSLPKTLHTFLKSHPLIQSLTYSATLPLQQSALLSKQQPFSIESLPLDCPAPYLQITFGDCKTTSEFRQRIKQLKSSIDWEAIEKKIYYETVLEGLGFLGEGLRLPADAGQLAGQLGGGFSVHHLSRFLGYCGISGNKVLTKEVFERERKGRIIKGEGEKEGRKLQVEDTAFEEFKMFANFYEHGMSSLDAIKGLFEKAELWAKFKRQKAQSSGVKKSQPNSLSFNDFFKEKGIQIRKEGKLKQLRTMQIVANWEELVAKYITQDKITENDVYLLMAGQGCTDFSHELINKRIFFDNPQLCRSTFLERIYCLQLSLAFQPDPLKQFRLPQLLPFRTCPTTISNILLPRLPSTQSFTKSELLALFTISSPVLTKSQSLAQARKLMKEELQDRAWGWLEKKEEMRERRDAGAWLVQRSQDGKCYMVRTEDFGKVMNVKKVRVIEKAYGRLVPSEEIRAAMSEESYDQARKHHMKLFAETLIRTLAKYKISMDTLFNTLLSSDQPQPPSPLMITPAIFCRIFDLFPNQLKDFQRLSTTSLFLSEPTPTSSLKLALTSPFTHPLTSLSRIPYQTLATAFSPTITQQQFTQGLRKLGISCTNKEAREAFQRISKGQTVVRLPEVLRDGEQGWDGVQGRDRRRVMTEVELEHIVKTAHQQHMNLWKYYCQYAKQDKGVMGREQAQNWMRDLGIEGKDITEEFLIQLSYVQLRRQIQHYKIPCNFGQSFERIAWKDILLQKAKDVLKGNKLSQLCNDFSQISLKGLYEYVSSFMDSTTSQHLISSLWAIFNKDCITLTELNNFLMDSNHQQLTPKMTLQQLQKIIDKHNPLYVLRNNLQAMSNRTYTARQKYSYQALSIITSVHCELSQIVEQMKIQALLKMSNSYRHPAPPIQIFPKLQLINGNQTLQTDLSCYLPQKLPCNFTLLSHPNTPIQSLKSPISLSLPYTLCLSLPHTLPLVQLTTPNPNSHLVFLTSCFRPVPHSLYLTNHEPDSIVLCWLKQLLAHFWQLHCRGYYFPYLTVDWVMVKGTEVGVKPLYAVVGEGSEKGMLRGVARVVFEVLFGWDKQQQQGQEDERKEVKRQFLRVFDIIQRKYRQNAEGSPQHILMNFVVNNLLFETPTYLPGKIDVPITEWVLKHVLPELTKVQTQPVLVDKTNYNVPKQTIAKTQPLREQNVKDTLPVFLRCGDRKVVGQLLEIYTEVVAKSEQFNQGVQTLCCSIMFQRLTTLVTIPQLTPLALIFLTSLIPHPYCHPPLLSSGCLQTCYRLLIDCPAPLFSPLLRLHLRVCQSHLLTKYLQTIPGIQTILNQFKKSQKLINAVKTYKQDGTVLEGLVRDYEGSLVEVVAMLWREQVFREGLKGRINRVSQEVYLLEAVEILKVAKMYGGVEEFEQIIGLRLQKGKCSCVKNVIGRDLLWILQKVRNCACREKENITNKENIAAMQTNKGKFGLVSSLSKSTLKLK